MRGLRLNAVILLGLVYVDSNFAKAECIAPSARIESSRSLHTVDVDVRINSVGMELSAPCYDAFYFLGNVGFIYSENFNLNTQKLRGRDINGWALHKFTPVNDSIVSVAKARSHFQLNLVCRSLAKILQFENVVDIFSIHTLPEAHAVRSQISPQLTPRDFLRYIHVCNRSVRASLGFSPSASHPDNGHNAYSRGDGGEPKHSPLGIAVAPRVKAISAGYTANGILGAVLLWLGIAVAAFVAAWSILERGYPSGKDDCGEN
ncbi:hypothetical protein VSX64_07380 [Aurantimonas sp. C2-6-R+9]|uniref:hypothetical protein n=1 Tax=unclassified Aurantimonas TaxID=2638230 RepID=UPI002E19EA2C|nr:MULTISPECIES: hypothetical protein [unclassified Aurantimonas]MEC5290689.1 hypothetical protein [Aurantimonas sp. C2-3-R2]MEC5380705.1 hypothetical protein [Aurantimonas sp. C2-6-R+9]MEC5411754.1 hypothetical protein [Aurantimonas sp. C2-4-R8]